ncbi:MAG: 50S ribosomal protein L23 [Gammaproteobacteria bacterium]|nr:MAG: 50S ribosomal protein L23 [Gammaproteobacteria bacterium]TDJ41848.1 MAG: 50S ribosomal protein L23 [Gammaproteobacteria bacterium]
MNEERMYTVLLEPHFSEKVAVLGDLSNQYAFKVARDASKPEIKAAVERLFDVRVKSVTTTNVKGKTKRTARGMTRKKNWKKAYVRLADGQDIDFGLAG